MRPRHLAWCVVCVRLCKRLVGLPAVPVMLHEAVRIMLVELKLTGLQVLYHVPPGKLGEIVPLQQTGT